MKKIKICISQSKVSNSFRNNISRAEASVKNASRGNCNIICFPEIFLTGFPNKKSYNHNAVLEAKRIFKYYCKNYRIFCIMGSIIEKIKNNYFNISYLIDDRGDIMGSYKKIHLVQNSEAKYIKSGNESKVFKTKLGNIGIQICRDLLYPDVTKSMMMKGAEIVFCPSFWCSKSPGYDWIYNHKYFKGKTPKEVDILASARAIENELVFAYANAAGKFNSGKYDEDDILLGRSQIALPFYGTTDIIDNNKEGLLIKEIDLSIVKDAKLVYKIEKDIKDIN